MTSRRKHVPLRSCVICGNKVSKRDLIRIVATPEGAVRVDNTGKMQGRGSYVCKVETCEPDMLRKGRLEHALRASISDEEWRNLISELNELKAAQAL